MVEASAMEDRYNHLIKNKEMAVAIHRDRKDRNPDINFTVDVKEGGDYFF